MCICIYKYIFTPRLLHQSPSLERERERERELMIYRFRIHVKLVLGYLQMQGFQSGDLPAFSGCRLQEMRALDFHMRSSYPDSSQVLNWVEGWLGELRTT